MAKKKKKRSRAMSYIGIVFGLLCILAWPLLEVWQSYERAVMLEEIEASYVTMPDAETEEMLAQAHAYNQVLAGDEPAIAEADIWPYEKQLAPRGHDVAFARVKIPRIGIDMPVYHGTDDAALSAGAGHLELTSLPVGGESTHTVISAHTGLAGMSAFDDLPQLDYGDVFGIQVAGEWYCYEIDDAIVKLPEEIDTLGITKGEDIATLLTCTPYGINTHRLLVTGHRIAVPDWWDSDVDPGFAPGRMWLVVICLVLIAMLVVWFCRKRYRVRVRTFNRSLKFEP